MDTLSQKQSSPALQVTDVGYLTNVQSLGASSKRRKVSDVTLIRMYQDKNLKVKDICNVLGISSATLYDNLKRLGVKTRQKPEPKGIRLSEKTKRKIYEMHSAGFTMYNIAKTLNTSTASVRYHLNKGIPAELFTPPPQVQVKPPAPVKTTFWSSIKGWFNR